VSSILVFCRETLPTLRYFPNDTELALGMILLELHWILQVFCVCQEDGGGVNHGEIVKAESSGEDPRATGGLVSNLPHPQFNKTKQHQGQRHSVFYNAPSSFSSRDNSH